MANEKKINAIADAEQAGLYYSSNTEEGFTRQIEGEKQTFVNSKGKPIKGKRDLKRIEEMTIPPAWTDVWICTEKNGHLQATGIDAKKRTQYIYHPIWTQLRSEAKFDKMSTSENQELVKYSKDARVPHIPSDSHCLS